MYKEVDVSNRKHARIRICAFSCEWHQPVDPHLISESCFSLFFCSTAPSGQFIVGPVPTGCHFLLQGIFPTQGLSPGLLHCRQMLYHLSHQGSFRNLKTFIIYSVRGLFSSFMPITFDSMKKPVVQSQQNKIQRHIKN